MQEGVENEKLLHHPTDTKSYWAYMMIHHPVYYITELIVCVLLMLLAFLERPEFFHGVPFQVSLRKRYNKYVCICCKNQCTDTYLYTQYVHTDKKLPMLSMYVCSNPAYNNFCDVVKFSKNFSRKFSRDTFVYLQLTHRLIELCIFKVTKLNVEIMPVCAGPFTNIVFNLTINRKYI